MQDVEMLVTDLRAILEENRSKHKETYDLAVEEYDRQLKDVVDKLHDALERSKSRHKVLELKMRLVHMPTPEIHLDDYDVAIAMLWHEKREKLIITSSEYAMYVLDKWNWMHAFVSNTTSYAVAASAR